MISITKILALLLVLNYVSSVPRHHQKRQALTPPQPSVDPQTIIVPNQPRSWNGYQCDCFCVCDKQKAAPAPTPSKPEPVDRPCYCCNGCCKPEPVDRSCYCCNGCCKPCNPQCCYYSAPPVVSQPSVETTTERIVNPCCYCNDRKPCKPQCCSYSLEYTPVSKPQPVVPGTTEPTVEQIINPCCPCNDMKPGQPMRLPQCCYNIDYMTPPVKPAPSKPVPLPQYCSYIDYSAMTPLPQAGSSEMVLPANTIQTPTTSIVGGDSVPLSDYWYSYPQETIIN